MTVEAVASGLSGIGGAGPVQGVEPTAFDPSVGGGQGPAVPSTQPVRESGLEPGTGNVESPARPGPAEVRASPRQSGDSIGHRVLDGMDRVQKGDVAWRGRPGFGQSPAGAAPEGPTLKVATRQPGPAESAMRPEAYRGPEIAGHPTTQPGQSQNPGFDAMVRQLEQVSGQVVQVSVVTKTTGSFTGSLNKLLSSG